VVPVAACVPAEQFLAKSRNLYLVPLGVDFRVNPRIFYL